MGFDPHEAPDRVDESFGQGGVVAITELPGDVSGLGVLSDGRIGVCGYAVQASNDAMVALLSADGELDVGFAGSGIELIDVAANDEAAGLVVEDDQLIVVGRTAAFGGGSEILIGRFRRDGSAVNASPLVRVNLTDTQEFASDVLRVAAETYVVVGRVNEPNIDGLALKLASTGARDPGFGISNGFVALDTDPQREALNGVVARGDGSLLMVGTTGPPPSEDIVITARTADGALAPGFGGGLVTWGSSTEADGAGAVVLDSNQRALVVGYSTLNGERDALVLGFTADGALDPSFGDQGVVRIDFANGSDTATAAVIDARGRILVAGESTRTGVSEMAVARLLPDGRLDPAFGVAGRLTLAISDEGSVVRRIVIDREQRLLLGGSITRGGLPRAAVVRLAP